MNDLTTRKPASSPEIEILDRIVRAAFPNAKIAPIAGATFRVTYYEACTDHLIPIKRIQDSFLVRVMPSDDGPVLVRQVETTKRLVKYSDKWTK